MKKTSQNSGAREKPTIDYFALMRSSEPIEAYNIKELHKRIAAAREEKTHRGKPKASRKSVR